MSEYKRCDICQKRFSEYGNNPCPFSGSVCCDKCNEKLVVPMRIYESIKEPSSAVLFKIDGTLERIKPKDKHFTSEELQILVKGKFGIYPEKIKGHLIICNEKVISTKFAPNHLFKKYSEFTLVSDVLLCPKSILEELDGKTYA